MVSCTLAAAARADLTPWYRTYRREYLRMLQFGEHETLDHPVACEEWWWRVCVCVRVRVCACHCCCCVLLPRTARMPVACQAVGAVCGQLLNTLLFLRTGGHEAGQRVLRVRCVAECVRVCVCVCVC